MGKKGCQRRYNRCLGWGREVDARQPLASTAEAACDRLCEKLTLRLRCVEAGVHDFAISYLLFSI